MTIIEMGGQKFQVLAQGEVNLPIIPKLAYDMVFHFGPVGQKIALIKLYREMTDCGLTDAKKMVELLMQHFLDTDSGYKMRCERHEQMLVAYDEHMYRQNDRGNYYVPDR